MQAKSPVKNASELTYRFAELYGEYSEKQLKRYENALEGFKKTFGENDAYVCSSSGRVELIGNHTDHNGGKVMSCAISLDTLAFFKPNGKNSINIFSEGYGAINVDLDCNSEVKKGTTAALIKGVAQGINDFGFKTGGFNAYITSTVLNGAGISSSAAFEVLI